MNIGTIVQDGMTLTAFLGDLPAQWSGNFDVTVSIDENFDTYTPYLSVGYMTDNIGRAVLLEIVDGTTTIPSVCFEHSGLIMMSVTLIKGEEILNTKPVTIKVEHAPMVLSQIDPEDEGVQEMLEALIDAKFEDVIPTGGTTGQVLMKNSNADYDLKWGNGGGGGGAVNSVNGQTGTVVLDAEDVGALPDETTFVSSFNGSSGAVTYTAPVTSVNGSTGAVVIGNATTSAAGLMSATDKQHLEAVYADYSSAITALGV